MARRPVYVIKTSRDHRLVVIEPINEAATRRLRALLKRLEEEDGDVQENPTAEDFEDFEENR